VSRPPVQRLVALFACLGVALGAIFVRLTVLQVQQAGALRDRAIDQRIQHVELPARRGEILDRNREPLAMTVEARDLYADPRYVVDPWATAKSLSPLLGPSPRDLAKLLRSSGTFVYLARGIGLDLARRIEALHLAGIGSLPATRRAYPTGSVASQVLGFVGVDGTGLSGLEFEYQRLLAGRPGERTEEVDPSGQPIVGGIDVDTPPVPGSSVVTTLDRAFQYQVEEALADAIARNHAHGGTVIAMSPGGEIYAMASLPSFDPRDFATSDPATYRARAITDAFEPGSTNKMITAAAALQSGVITPTAEVPVPSEVPIGPFTIHDAEAHPFERMTLGDILAESSNVGIARTAERLGPQRLGQFMWRFGLGRRTGIGFPGESGGVMLPPAEWGKTVMVTASYGAGLAATPLQMISAYATIANGGRRAQPRLVRGAVDPSGTFRPTPVQPAQRVVSAETAQMVTRMLVYAVQAGTGVNAQIAGYEVAGKTGTARIPRTDGAGYVAGRYMASFIGFLPASDPKVVIAAILDQPVTQYGGVAAAPLFRQVARDAIVRFDIGPSATLPLPPHRLPVP
jgi:cell division protein FtsI (penicillin-binding protein 3)